MTTPNRTRIARWSTAIERHIAYRIPEGVEVETSQNYEVVRRRVFFDDVVMITLHREHTPLYLVLTGLFALIFIMIGFGLLFTELKVASIYFFAIASPGVIAFVLRLLFGMDVITLIGGRSKASIRFGLRKGRVRELYGSLCAEVAENHRRLAREYAQEAPPLEAPLPDLPPGPPA
ncbi:MAG: hypothetical protein QOH21_868 [Acidobacteriota bacterium]|jgi:hypothetical protein|nr:hypothetical protein [Acidobacteriota bacterium]